MQLVQPTVLVIDDDSEIRYSLERVLSSRRYTVILAASGEEGIKMARSCEPEVILLDIRMGGMSGLEALQHIRADSPHAMVILMTAFGTTQTAIEAMKYGAFDYIIKPFDLKKILKLIDSAVEASKDLRGAEVKDYKHLLNSDDYKEGIVGNSQPMQDVFKVVGQVAGSDVTVMVTGESGTGKELVARCIYQHSHRAGFPFIAVNCAAIPENLIESELFGHEKGAFTGATNQRLGKFELCDRGTIFLDEIGDMTLPTQTKILRVLQEGEIQRVGGSGTLKVNVRILAATNKDLEKMVKAGEFREDLYYRLNVVRVRLPSLRERLEDIPHLVDFLLQKLHKNGKARAHKISAEALVVLQNYRWTGNVRELENVVYRSAVVAKGDTILAKDLPKELLIEVESQKITVCEKTLEGSDVQTGDEGVVANAGTQPTEVVREASANTTTVPVAKDVPVVEESLMIGSGNDVQRQLETLSLEDAFDFLYKRIRDQYDKLLLQMMEEGLIKRALKECGGNQLRTSALLGITRATLRKRIEEFDLKV